MDASLACVLQFPGRRRSHPPRPNDPHQGPLHDAFHVPRPSTGPQKSAQSDPGRLAGRLVSHLRQVSAVTVVGSHRCSRTLRAMLAETPVDIVLLDYSLASDDLDGMALIKALRLRYPELRILVVSGHCQHVTVNMLLREGANGFFAKHQEAVEMAEAITRVMAGETYLPPFLTAVTPARRSSPLSPREWEVIRCFLDGMSVSQIAAKFNRSLKTISTQKSTAYKKLGIQSDAELFKMRDQVLQARSMA